MAPDLSKDIIRISKLGVGVTFPLSKYFEKKPQGKEHLAVNLEQVDETMGRPIRQEPEGQGSISV